MPNRFYKAFNQFSQDVDTSEIKTFQQLLMQITQWGIDRNGVHHINLDSHSQLRAIAKEGKEQLGLLTALKFQDKRVSSKGKQYIHTFYMDMSTSKFTSKEEYNLSKEFEDV